MGIALPLGLMLGGLATEFTGNIMAGRKREEARLAEIERRKRDARRQAIERAINSKIIPSRFEEPMETDLTTPSIISGLGRIATTMGTSGLIGR